VELENLWKECLDIIKDNVNEKAFSTWFKPIVPIKYEGSDLTIQVPSHFFYEYIEEHFAHLIYATLTRITNKNTTIYYRVFVDNSDEKKGHTTIQSDRTILSGNELKKTAVQIAKAPDLLTSTQEWYTHLNDHLNFRNFYEGESNRLARRVGETIGEQPGKTFNPLFIYGNTGVGKTHLCHAIGNLIQERHPENKVIYISSHLFQLQFTDASRNNTANDFINFYQGVDALIIDDIQEFVGKEKTQNAYFHIFNHLKLLGKQLILTSDKLPMDLQGIEERMITRMKSGMTAELGNPDFDLRKQILHNRAKLDDLTLTEEMIDYIAERVTEHVRDLEGIITSLIAQSVLCNREIDFDLVRRVVDQFIKPKKTPAVISDAIQPTVSSFFNIEIKEMHSQSRKQEMVKARQIAMYFYKKYTNYSYAYIGYLVGKRDHATVLHAVRTIQDLIEVDKSFRSTMDEIDTLLKK